MPKNNTDTVPSMPPTLEPTPEPTTTVPPTNLTKAMPYVMGLLLVGAVGAALSFYLELSELKVNPQRAAAEESRATIEAVSKLIVLPADEQPTIATVSDPTKLADQPFFAQAKVGDKVLIYTNAKKAILYDPVSNRILEVAPVNIGNSNSQPQVSGATTETKKK